jgi:hypothetical protein
MALRCSLDSFAALALPPFIPPNFPKATAAGFFVHSWSGSAGAVAEALAFDRAPRFMADRNFC